MTPYIAGSIFLVVAIGCAVKGAENWRTFRRGKRQPLLWNVSASQITAIPVTWPLDQTPWPPPWSQEKGVMEVEVARAYSVLADRTRRNLLLAADVLLVVGGSWLGVTLDDIWKEYLDASATATKHLQEQTTDFATQLPTLEAIAHLLPAGMIWAGVVCARLVHAYETAQEMYQEATVIDATAVSVITEPVRTGLRGFLERLIKRNA